MTETQIGQHVGIGNKRIGEQEAQRGRLNRSSEVQRAGFKSIGQVSNDGFTDIGAAAAVEHQTEGALSIVLANEDYGSLKERAAQLAAVQEQLAFQVFLGLGHRVQSTIILASKSIWISFLTCQNFPGATCG